MSYFTTLAPLKPAEITNFECQITMGTGFMRWFSKGMSTNYRIPVIKINFALTLNFSEIDIVSTVPELVNRYSKSS